MVAGGKGEEYIAAAIATNPAHPGQPRRRPPRQPLALDRQQRRVGRQHHDDRPAFRHPARPMRRHDLRPDFLPHRHPVHPQLPAHAVIRLHQRPDSIAVHHPRRRAGAAFELVADHPGAAAHISLRHRAAGRSGEGRQRMRAADRKAFDLVQPPVIGLGHHRQMERRPVPIGNLADRIPHNANLIRVGNADRRTQQPLLGNPGHAGHFAIAVERMDAGETVIAPDFIPTRPDRRHPGADNMRLIGDQRGAAHLHPRHIGNRIQRSRRQFAGDNAEVAQPGSLH